MPRPSRPIELRESDRCQGTQPPPEAPGWPPWEGRVDSLGGRSTRLARSSTTRSQSMTTSPRPDLQALLPHGDGPGAITPDGCSVELYSALTPAQEPRIVHDAIPHGASILELGAGAGRVTHALLALGRRFDAVLFASYLLNVPDLAWRRTLLAACARHVSDHGCVLIQREEPEWFDTAAPFERHHGELPEGELVPHAGRDQARARAAVGHHGVPNR